MAKSLKVIRIVAFIIITLQIALVAAFSVLYFPNFLNIRDYVSNNYVLTLVLNMHFIGSHVGFFSPTVVGQNQLVKSIVD